MKEGSSPGPKHTCTPSLNEIHEIIFEYLHTSQNVWQQQDMPESGRGVCLSIAGTISSLSDERTVYIIICIYMI